MADDGFVPDKPDSDGFTPDGFVPDTATKQPKSWLGEVGNTVANWWSQVNPAAQARGVASAAMHPINALSEYGKQNQEIASRAEKAFKEGRYAEGVSHAINYLLNGLPGVGSTLDQAGQQMQSGDVSGGIGTTLGLGTNLVLGAKAPEITRAAVNAPEAIRTAVQNRIPNVNNPVVEQALQSVEPNVPMSVGQRTGNAAIQRVEQGLENVPGSASKTQQFFNAQQDALAKEGRAQAAQVSPVQTNAYGAGDAVQRRLQQRITRLKGQADNLYDSVRSDVEKNQQTVQTGTKSSSVLDQFGNPIQTPVMQTFDTPVSLAPIRQRLAPVYQDLQRSMPEARRAASPAFRALQDLMTSGDEYMSAMDFDRSLGAIKSLARDGQSPYLTSQSQGIAKQVIQSGEQQLQAAMKTAGPDTLRTFQSARKMVRSYHDTADMLQDLNSEPAALYSNLTTGGDRVFNTLQELNRIAPNQVRTIGRTFLESLLDKATKEGGFSRAPGIMADWNKLGPETKQLLFGKQAGDIDNFMLAAKTLTKNPNPSGTAKMMAALGSYGAVGSALWSVLIGHPMNAALVGAGMIGSRAVADLLLSPGGARKLAGSLSPTAAGALRGTAALGIAGRSQDDQEPQLTSPEQ